MPRDLDGGSQPREIDLMGIPIARVFGIEIRVSFSWGLILAVVAVIAMGQVSVLDPRISVELAWILGGVVALGFFLSSLFHDLAHALVARRRGVEVSSIAVSFFGGTTPLDPSSSDPRHDAAIAASGPIVSLVIALVLLALATASAIAGPSFGAATSVLVVLVFLNLVLGLVNLVPAYPLDGGRIIRDLAWRRSGSEARGWEVAARSGRITGFLVIAAGIAVLVGLEGPTGAMIALTGWFLILSANALRERVRLEDLVRGRTIADAMETDPVTVTPTLTVDTFASQLLDGESPLTAVPVVQGDEIVGMLGIRQVRSLRRDAWTTKRVEEVMVRPPKVEFLSPGDLLRSGLERVHRAGLDGLPVVDDGRLVGVLTRRSVGMLLRAAQEAPGESAARPPGDPHPQPPAEPPAPPPAQPPAGDS